MNLNKLISLLRKESYEKSDFGFKRISQDGDVTHCLTILSDEVQLYGYWRDTEEDSYYDTGIIKVSNWEIEMLIKIFKRKYT